MMKKAPEKFRFAAVAVDIVVFGIHDGELKVLITDIDRPPHYRHSQGFPGGLIDSSESADDTTRRHLKEKVGLEKVFTEQLYTFSDIFRDKRNRVIAVAYYGLVPPKVTESYSHAGASWVSIDKVGKLAYDHNNMLKVALSRLRGKLLYTNIAQFVLSKQFTLTEIQLAYEIITKKLLDKRNFRKKILSLGVIEETGESQGGMKNRPAALYRFTAKKIIELPLFV